MICIRSSLSREKKGKFFLWPNYVEKIPYPHPYFSYSTYQQATFWLFGPFLHNCLFFPFSYSGTHKIRCRWVKREKRKPPTRILRWPTSKITQQPFTPPLPPLFLSALRWPQRVMVAARKRTKSKISVSSWQARPPEVKFIVLVAQKRQRYFVVFCFFNCWNP